MAAVIDRVDSADSMLLREPRTLEVRSEEYEAASPDLPIAALLFVLAALTRFYGLGQWDIILDEIFTVNEAANRIYGVINPLYYWLVVLTREYVAQPELAARLPSAVLGTLAIPVFYLTWSRIAGRYAAAIGAILILLAEWTLWHSQYGRFFQGTFLFGSLAYYWFLRAIIDGAWRKLVLSFVAAVIATGFHIGAATIIVGCGTMSMLLAFGTVEGVGERGRKLAKLYLGACAVAALATLPVLWSVVSNRSAAGLSWAQGPFRMLLYVVDDVEIGIVFGALAGWLASWVYNRLLAIYFGICAGIAIAALLAVAPFAAVRSDYVFHIMPLAYLLAGVFAARVAAALASDGVLRHAVAVLIVATLLPGTVSHYLGRMTLHAREPAQFIASNHAAGDRIVAFDAGIRFYLDPALEVERYLGNPYSDRRVVDGMQTYLCSERRTWLAFRTRRQPIIPEVEHWLLRHARLVWRHSAERFDLHTRGFEIFLVPAGADCQPAPTVPDVSSDVDTALSQPL